MRSEVRKRNLKQKLDRFYLEMNKPEFILSDPVQFPHRYSAKHDREIAAFLAATIAWGRRDLILKSAEKMFSLMGPSPYAFIMEEKYRNIKIGDGRGRPIHRTFFEGDLIYFCKGFKECYTKFGSLESFFAITVDVWEPADVWKGISFFRETMARGNSAAHHAKAKQPVYSKHIANPAANSACKRLHLALRWLVRREGPVDMGLWKSISPSSLFIPLDLHVGRTARSLGLLDRKSNDKKAVISLTEKLREFCPEDPAKYDLALVGYSIFS
jgi:uncharacterized protein (TIGR02757 family)